MKKPFFVVIWYGSPHGPFVGLPKDVALYDDVPDPKMRQRFAEITAMDRSIGTLRAGLRKFGVADQTLIWFNSDNGIPPQIDSFNGRWRGSKGGIDEGSFLGPGLIEWPAVITTPRVSAVPCVTSDILPTVLDLVGVPYPDPGRPLDGISLRELHRQGESGDRGQDDEATARMAGFRRAQPQRSRLRQRQRRRGTWCIDRLMHTAQTPFTRGPRQITTMTRWETPHVHVRW